MLGLGFRGARVDTHIYQYLGMHGMYVSIAYLLSVLDISSCARRLRLGAILGRGAGRVTIRVRVRVSALFTRLAIRSGPRRLDMRESWGIVGVVHAHDLDVSAAACGPVSKML